MLAGLACVLILTLSAAGRSAAHRPPASERAYQQGRAAYLAGRFGDADRFFEQALSPKRDHFESLVGRGRAKLALAETQRDVLDAYLFFDEARHLRATGKVLALCGYCQALLTHHEAAELYATDAEKAGYTCAALYSNRSHSRAETSKFAEAAADLEEAFKRDPDLASAYCNRAMLSYRRWLFARSAPLTEQAVSDMQFVLDYARAHGRLDMRLFLDAAFVYAAASPAPRDALADAAIQYLRKAVEMGASPSTVKDLTFQRRLLGNPALPAERQLTQRTVSSKITNNPHLTDPVDGLD
jgi:tetratricopeptide (TPR) repeat protein